jgi:hypothetical protein
MIMKEPPPIPPPFVNLPTVLAALFDGLSYSMEVSLHKDLGERRIRDGGGRMFLTLALLVVIALACQPPGPVPDPDLALLLTIGYYLPFLLCLALAIDHLKQRRQALLRQRQGGPSVHSRYTGLPRALHLYRRFWPSLTEEQCKCYVEPLVGMLLAAITGFFNPLVAIYLFLGTALMAATAIRSFHQQREQAMDATDGVQEILILQENVAARMNPVSPEPMAAAQVVAPAAPAAAPPRRQPPKPAAPAVAPPLYQGLDDNLMRLLQEEHRED